MVHLLSLHRRTRLLAHFGLYKNRLESGFTTGTRVTFPREFPVERPPDRAHNNPMGATINFTEFVIKIDMEIRCL